MTLFPSFRSKISAVPSVTRANLLPTVAVVALIGAISFFYARVLHVNPTTVALTFLAAVVIVSAFWPRRFAVALAILSTLAYNFFFLPPLHTFVISEGQNWVALIVFLLTALVATDLAERARESALTAERKRRELERLYNLSHRLLAVETVADLTQAIPRHLLEVFSAKLAGLLLKSSGVAFFEPPGLPPPISELRKVIQTGLPLTDQAHAIVPVQSGDQPIGAIAITGGEFSLESMQAAGALVAIAIQRAEAIENLSRAEAARENARLRSALLDSVAHSFRTPLTSIKASVTGLLSGVEFDASQRDELLTVINEETDRLNSIVGEAAEMAQLDAGMLTLQFAECSLENVISSALESTRALLSTEAVSVDLPPDLPLVRIDARRIEDVLKHLLDNAARFTAVGTPIRISAEGAGPFVRVNVADRGPGIATEEQPHIFEKFYRGLLHRESTSGTGMGLAICKVIVEEHGGTISVASSPGKGSAFSFTIPTAESVF
jgi:two-component system sensor histidine kinase KdpD